MKIVSLNVGSAEPISIGKSSQKTGIFKKPAGGAVYVGKLGLEGDVQVDKKHHGGADQAVYLYSAEDYAWWSTKLDRQLKPGAFGENITLSSFGDGDCCVGDRLRCGQVLLELTAPRIPCATLAARMQDPGFVKKFSKAGRPGFYARVLEEGSLEEGIDCRWERRGTFPLSEVFALFFSKEPDEARLEALLNEPIAGRLRDMLAE